MNFLDPNARNRLSPNNNTEYYQGRVISPKVGTQDHRLDDNTKFGYNGREGQNSSEFEGKLIFKMIR